MDTHELFKEFNDNIKLNDSKIKKLRINRDALRNKIRDFFKEKEWEIPCFYSQGSFPLKTNINPIKKEEEDSIKEKYDLDDGIYLFCKKDDRKEVSTYHDRVSQAVEGHAKNQQDKNTCVRVIYTDGHHIDLPIYLMENQESIPLLAHKKDGFIESDPKAFYEWVKSKISETSQQEQLHRLIRYFKAWKDYRENSNSNVKLPSGFILTILACNNYSEDKQDNVAFKSTIRSIKESLELNFSCHRPTAPTGEDLLKSYSKNKDSILSEFNKFYDCEGKASKYWQKVFGERFPLGNKSKNDSGTYNTQKTFSTQVSNPWLPIGFK